MSMFDAYKLISEDYIPRNTQPVVLEEKIKKPLIAYNKLGEPVGFTWSQGDTICLEFLTTGNVVYEDGDLSDVPSGFVESAKTYLSHSDKVMQLYLYDFRYRIVASAEKAAQAKIVFTTSDLKTENLATGVYRLQLNLLDKSTSVQHTLIRGDDCQIFIR